MKLLLTVKVEGSHGCMRLADLGRNWRRECRVTAKAWDALLAAATAGEDPAVIIDGGWLHVLNWAKYQPDPKAAERMANLRKRRNQAKNEAVTGRYGNTPNTPFDRTTQNNTEQNKQPVLTEKAVVTTDASLSPSVCLVHDKLLKALEATKESHKRGAGIVILVATGMHPQAANAMADRHPLHRIRLVCRYALRRKARNPAGMIRAALEENWDLRSRPLKQGPAEGLKGNDDG